jgi:phosphohistidine swiveling domain-containing protein
MPSAVMYSGKWRIKPSGKIPIFLRFVINSSFTKAIANRAKIRSLLPNRTYLNHMMYWKAEEYNRFEAEVIGHLKKNDGWFEGYCQRELIKAENLYKRGLALEKIDWTKKSNKEMSVVLKNLIEQYRESCCPWYVQYPLDEYFEAAIETHLLDYLQPNNKNFRKYVLIFTDPELMTEVSEERWKLVKLAKEFLSQKENFNKLSPQAIKKLQLHLKKFAYINRGLATSHAYTLKDMINRLVEIKKQVQKGKPINQFINEASEEKVSKDYKWALNNIKPSAEFKKVIQKARHHSYVRNRRVEAFFKADDCASLIYHEIAKRNKFNPEWIMDVSVPEMLGALEGKKLPSKSEMARRLKNYAMLVRNAQTKLVSDPKEIKKMAKQYFVKVKAAAEVRGQMACLGGIIRGRAKVCLDKSEIHKVKRGDILIAQFTTPDFVPAMERAAAVVADQGGLSSHAAIVSRELGVPCVIATTNGTRIIKDNDLLEIDAHKGIVKILKKA